MILKDVRSIREPNCDSDHFLVRVQHKHKIQKINADKHIKERKGMKKNWIIQVSLRNIGTINDMQNGTKGIKL
jgi:hypothetical protein